MWKSVPEFSSALASTFTRTAGVAAASLPKRWRPMLEPDVPVTVTGSIAAILTIIEAARAARRFPVILELLTDGSMTLTTVCLLASHLTAGNYREALEQARHKSKREIEQLIAAMCPRPAVPSVIRKLPDPTAPTSTELEPSAAVRPSAGVPVGDVTPHHVPVPLRPTPAILTPLAPERYQVQLTIGRATHHKLRQIQDLLRHVVPTGDPAAIFDRALTVLLQDLERRKVAQVSRPRESALQCDARGMCPRRCGAPCGNGTTAAVPSSARTADARNEASSNSTMSFRLPLAARRRWRTFSYGAAAITRMRRGSILASPSFASSRSHTRLGPDRGEC